MIDQLNRLRSLIWKKISDQAPLEGANQREIQVFNINF